MNGVMLFPESQLARRGQIELFALFLPNFVTMWRFPYSSAFST
jgi:hypothetical protein